MSFLMMYLNLKGVVSTPHATFPGFIALLFLPLLQAGALEVICTLQPHSWSGARYRA